MIHVDHPTGISANAKPQIIATVEAMILLSPHSTSATAQAVSTSGAIASAAFTERLSSTEESEVPIKLAIPKLSSTSVRPSTSNPARVMYTGRI